MKLKILVSTLLLGLVVVLTGCDVDIKSDNTEYAFGSYVDVVCFDAELSQSQYDNFFHDANETIRVPIEKKLNTALEKCDSFKTLYTSVASVFDKLKKGVLLPETVFFNLKIDSTDIRPIGFFNSLAACNDAKRKVEKIGYSAAVCYERTLFWKHVWN